MSLGFLIALGAALAPTPSNAQELARGDFEAGDGSDIPYTSERGSVVSDDCHGGSYCGAMRVVEECDQDAMFVLDGFSHAGEIYAAAWYRFPADWSWRQSDVCAQSNDFKAILFETDDSRDRSFLNFRDGRPVVLIEGGWAEPRAGWVLEGSGTIPTDGLWHYIEVHIDRVPGPNAGHVDVWLDDTRVIDEDYTTCMGSCSAFTYVKFGAYHNFAFASPGTFFMDDLVVSAGPISEFSERPDAGAGTSPDASRGDGSIAAVDAGASGAADAGGIRLDGGSTEPPASSAECGCRAVGQRSRGGPLGLTFLLAAVVVWRRRRRDPKVARLSTN